MIETKPIIVVAVLVALGVILLWGCGERARQRYHHDAVKRITRDLQLNESQKAMLTGLETGINSKRKELCMGKRTIKTETEKQIRGETFDPRALKDVVGTELKKINIVFDILIDQYAEFHSTLTPEQKDKLREIIAELHRKSHGRSHVDFCERT